MAIVDPRIADKVAHTAGVKAAVRAKRDELEAVVKGEFASHDHPGGHTITSQDGRTDALVSLDGPAPLSVEFGHWAGKGENRTYVEGLHLFGKAMAQLEAEGR